MMTPKVIAQLKENSLTGRGGASFPTGHKWEAVHQAPGPVKYIICNAAEGDPNTYKDGFILEHFPHTVLKGISVALETFKDSEAYIYLRKDYFRRFVPRLKKSISDLPIKFFKKTGGYLAGEETVVINAIEGKRLEPRKKPPYPTQKGLFGMPTLINNTESFYHIARIIEGKYRQTRFYSIGGDVENAGVYELPISYTVKQILKETGNYPQAEFFVQSGAGVCGEILLPRELDQPVGCLGSIHVFDRGKTQPMRVMNDWVNFFLAANCDKCVPCREGIYRIAEMINDDQIDQATFLEILGAMEETSFCALGRSAVIPFRSFYQKIIL